MNSTVEKEFSALEGIYLNSAYLGPLPRRSCLATEKLLSRLANPTFWPFEEWQELPEKVRASIAQILGVRPESIAHHGSVSEIVSQIALGFPFKTGDIVVGLQGEYPSDVLAWMLHRSRGYDFKFLQLADFFDPSTLSKKLPARTRILNLSHVAFHSGERIDLRQVGEVLRERGIFFVVDTSQALGGISLRADEIKCIDVLMCATYKWLLGPYGHAFAYYSDSALSLLPRLHGKRIVDTKSNANIHKSLTDYTLEIPDGAFKFDRGQTANVLAMTALLESLSLISEIGLSQLEDHNLQLVRQFLAGVPSDKYQILSRPDFPSSIVCLKPLREDSLSVSKRLRDFAIDHSLREGNLRFAFHLFNTAEQAQKLSTVL